MMCVCVDKGATTCWCMSRDTTIKRTSTLRPSICRCIMNPIPEKWLWGTASQYSTKYQGISLSPTMFLVIYYLY